MSNKVSGRLGTRLKASFPKNEGFKVFLLEVSIDFIVEKGAPPSARYICNEE